MSDDSKESDDKNWQRLDTWLWCARFLKTRSESARLIAGGLIRINRQVTDKAHARLRVGDVLTLPLAHHVRVVQVAALAGRRGPATEARALYRDMAEPTSSSWGCTPERSGPYASSEKA